MKQNSNKAHMVISVSDDGKGIEINEDLAGTLPQLCFQVTLYIIHFCQQMANKGVFTDGTKISKKKIFLGIVSSVLKGLDDDINMEESDE